MKQYHDLLRLLLDKGTFKEDRTGVGTFSVFGHQVRFNLEEGFPLLTTKRVHFKSVVHELLWFLRGDTNVKYLNERGVSIWNEWANKEGDLGPVYGAQWRSWKTYHQEGDKLEPVVVDQIAKVIKDIKNNPNSRRLIVSAWNVGDLPRMALEPCHTLFQFYVSEGKLSCHVYQRSMDVGLGAPFNFASYALLLSMVAQVVNLKPYELVYSIGDLHLYRNHVNSVITQLSRPTKNLPILKLNTSIKCIDDFKYEDIIITGYEPHPYIKMDIAV